MTARTYLSIGDVLTLLREEFPDVTISKIRFLESQGLVNPERSPSGYRKFFEADVERLRWVLRQQREHFLPLKVIRDRLADEDSSESEGAPYEAAGNGRAAEPVHATAAAGAGAGAGTRGRARTAGAAGTATVAPPMQEPATHTPSNQAGDDAMARILADASRRAGRAPAGAAEHITLEPAVPDLGAPLTASAAPLAGGRPATAEVRGGVETGTRSTPPHEQAGTVEMADARSAVPQEAPRGVAPIAPPPTPSMTRTQSTQTPGERTTVADVRVAADAPAPTSARPLAQTGEAPPAPRGAEARGQAEGHTVSAATSTGRAPETSRQGGTADPKAVPPEKRVPTGGRAGGTAGERSAPAASEAPASSTTSIVTGASMTTQELCTASGLSEIELAGLQGFGLIEPVMVAGIPTFDEDALTVANLAADFRKFGIEARHLRPYRNAVDREMGLIEQVIIPLLRQRNPESRQRAADAADELGALGQTMRATLLRSALKRHVGG